MPDAIATRIAKARPERRTRPQVCRIAGCKIDNARALRANYAGKHSMQFCSGQNKLLPLRALARAVSSGFDSQAPGLRAFGIRRRNDVRRRELETDAQQVWPGVSFVRSRK